MLVRRLTSEEQLRLCAALPWSLLQQIFVNGGFVAGVQCAQLLTSKEPLGHMTIRAPHEEDLPSSCTCLRFGGSKEAIPSAVLRWAAKNDVRSLKAQQHVWLAWAEAKRDSAVRWQHPSPSTQHSYVSHLHLAKQHPGAHHLCQILERASFDIQQVVLFCPEIKEPCRRTLLTPADLCLAQSPAAEQALRSGKLSWVNVASLWNPRTYRMLVKCKAFGWDVTEVWSALKRLEPSLLKQAEQAHLLAQWDAPAATELPQRLAAADPAGLGWARAAALSSEHCALVKQKWLLNQMLDALRHADPECAKQAEAVYSAQLLHLAEEAKAAEPKQGHAVQRLPCLASLPLQLQKSRKRKFGLGLPQLRSSPSPWFHYIWDQDEASGLALPNVLLIWCKTPQTWVQAHASPGREIFIQNSGTLGFALSGNSRGVGLKTPPLHAFVPFCLGKLVRSALRAHLPFEMIALVASWAGIVCLDPSPHLALLSGSKICGFAVGDVTQSVSIVPEPSGSEPLTTYAHFREESRKALWGSSSLFLGADGKFTAQWRRVGETTWAAPPLAWGPDLVLPGPTKGLMSLLEAQTEQLLPLVPQGAALARPCLWLGYPYSVWQDPDFPEVLWVCEVQRQDKSCVWHDVARLHIRAPVMKPTGGPEPVAAVRFFSWPDHMVLVTDARVKLLLPAENQGDVPQWKEVHSVTLCPELGQVRACEMTLDHVVWLTPARGLFSLGPKGDLHLRALGDFVSSVSWDSDRALVVYCPRLV